VRAVPGTSPSALDLGRAELEALLRRLGQPRYRADQVLSWIHGRGVVDPAAMTDLPRALRDALARELAPDPGSRPGPLETSADGTTKLGLALRDGSATETVLIPEDDEEDDEGPAGDEAGERGRTRLTQCLSTQVGCAFRCAFCRSGTLGFVRHLTAGEILAQRLWARRTLGERGAIVRTVLMGVGEPLQNVDGVFAALRLLLDPHGGAVSPRRVTVSTVGVPEGIRGLGEAFGGRVGLAWSLHAADEETRRALLPVASRRPVGEVLDALRAYPLPPRRRITVECVLCGGVNDSERHARSVARLLSGLRCKVNLIPFNPWPPAAGAAAEASVLRPPSAERLAAYREALAAAGCSTFVRRPRGADILAACGQLLGRADLSAGGRWDS
jgi:23S rRNA (adenine2503-C2)-methyltransferase